MSKPKPVCSVDGCEQDSAKRGYCNAHYLRVLRHGDPGPARRLRRAPGDIVACLIAGCERRARSRGYCNTHAERLRLRGSLDTPGPKSGPESPNWKNGSISYRTAHTRVAKERGAASDFECQCGRQAIEWAYDHADPRELSSAKGNYSQDPSHYVAMCKACHIAFDKRHARALRLASNSDSV